MRQGKKKTRNENPYENDDTLPACSSQPNAPELQNFLIQTRINRQPIPTTIPDHPLLTIEKMTKRETQVEKKKKKKKKNQRGAISHENP